MWANIRHLMKLNSEKICRLRSKLFVLTFQETGDVNSREFRQWRERQSPWNGSLSQVGGLPAI